MPSDTTGTYSERYQPRRLPPPAHSARTRSGLDNEEVKRAVGLVSLGALAATVVTLGIKKGRENPVHYRPADDAPLHARVKNRMGDYAIVGRTVTINKPKAELYAYFRDFSNLPNFMENVVSITPASGGDGTRHDWRIRAPAGRIVDVVTEVTGDTEGEMIGWRSVAESDIDTTGHVAFRDAPGDRGTEVELVVAYDPPGGRIGQAVAKLMQREPHVQARRDLKRFKMLMEAGEVATAQPYPDAN